MLWLPLWARAKALADAAQAAANTAEADAQTGITNAAAAQATANTAISNAAAAQATANAALTANFTIDGDFDWARHATSAALTTAVAYGVFDLWWAYMHTSAAGTVSQVSSPKAGFRKALKLQRTPTSALTGIIEAGQTLETIDATKLQGQTANFSFWAAAGANFSAAGSTLTCAIDTGTGTDQSAAMQSAGTWTGEVTTTQANTITTTPTRFSMTLAVPAGATQIGYRFFYTPAGTAGADDSATITGARLRPGTVVSDAKYRDVGEELVRIERCFRRCESDAGNDGYVASGTCNSTTVGLIPVTRFAGMRTVPALSESALADVVARTNGSAIALSALAIAGPAANPLLTATVASGMVLGQAVDLVISAGIGKFIEASARL